MPEPEVEQHPVQLLTRFDIILVICYCPIHMDISVTWTPLLREPSVEAGPQGSQAGEGENDQR